MTIKQIWAGDALSIKQLHELYVRVIFNKMVVKYGGCFQDAEDVFQDALIVVLSKEHAPNFELTSSFKTFFSGICRYITRKKFQSKYSEKVSFPDVTVEIQSSIDLENDLLEKERYNFFVKSIENINNDKFQKIIQLHLQGYSNQKIRRVLNMSTDGYVRIRKHRAINRLKKETQKMAKFY